MVADDLPGGILDLLAPANVDTNAGVKFQRLAAGRGLGAAKHDADFFAQLIGENTGGFGLGHDCGELAQCLAHQARLHAHGGHAHVALQLSPGHQRGHGIDDNHI